MGNPYTSQSASGYNDNPPADDGSQVSSNRVLWSTIKTKLADVVKTLAENINSAVSTAFGKVVGGAGVLTTATSYQVLSADQGKLINVTATGQTITTPSATDVGSPFVFCVLNNNSGTCTLDGSGSQTVNGAASITLAAGQGVIVYTDGSNWFAVGSFGSAAALSIASLSATSATLTGAMSAATVAGAAVATQANMEAASAVDLIVTPGRQHFHPGMAKGWAKITGATGAIDADYGVDSVARNGAGDYTLTWSTAFSSNDYVVTGAARLTTALVVVRVHTLTTTTARVTVTKTSDGTEVDPTNLFVVAFGDI